MITQLYPYILYVFVPVALLTFVLLFFITAPYGRHVKNGWGPRLSETAGWIIMEAPASLLFVLYFVFSEKPVSAVLLLFFILWQFHYFHRAFIFPFRLRASKRMPLSVIFMGVFFNLVNTCVQGTWLFFLSPETMYGNTWLADPRFILGFLFFVMGYFINKKSDALLRKLRRPGETGYRVPFGFLYRYVSCPNYFGELIEWLGWTLMTWSFAGLFFLIWTAANLVPRARSNHRWYRAHFPDYPPERKAMVPWLW
jgi:3-oxo-5-alpha-steroid 4-dehydrogenase 1